MGFFLRCRALAGIAGVLGLAALGAGGAVLTGAAAPAAAETRPAERPATGSDRPFCTTGCRPRDGALTSGIGFAVGVAATALAARRRGAAR